MTLKLYVPTSESSGPVTPYTLGIDPAVFVGTLGFIANSQPGSVAFLAALAPEVIAGFAGAVGTHFEDKGPTPARSGVAMTDAELDRLAASCDAAILAYGHCGGCTAATIRDAIGLARRGIPVVALVVPFFEPSARLLARSLRMPDLPIHILPGPMARKDDDRRREIARSAAGDIIAMLAGSAIRTAA